MIGITRRDFMKYLTGSAAALGLSTTVLGRLQSALAADGSPLPTVLWLNGANCTGCTVSLANLVGGGAPSDVADLLVNTVNLAFHPNLMGAAGDQAVGNLKAAAAGDYILAVDGGIPTAFGGHACVLWTDGGREVTAEEALLSLAPGAMAVLAIGSCASFGGIPSGDPNPTGIVSVAELAGGGTIRIPGCPTHPDWIVWTVANLLAGVDIELDEDGRPTHFFHHDLMRIHKNCPRKGKGETDVFGVPGRCLKELGCKGPKTSADCFNRRWNGGTNWCIGADAVCLGCTENGFPDKFSPFYEIEYGYELYEKPSGEETPPEETPQEGTVRITRAVWDAEKQKLDVRAEEGDGSETLTLSYYGETYPMTYKADKNRYEFKLEPTCYDDSVSIRSTSGAGAALAVSVKNGTAVDHKCGGDGATTIDIVKSTWDAEKRKLDVRAESGDGSETLTLAYGGKNYPMTYKADKNHYEFKRERICFDDRVVIRSTSGASAAMPVSVKNGSGSEFACRSRN